MARKSGKSAGSRNSGKSPVSDRSNKIDLDKEKSNIDLRKNDDINLGDKESDSDNFGEFSKEIELYNDDEGTSISGVIGVDVVPLGLNISANGDIGTVGIDIGLPGNVIGIGGSLNINMETGEIVGGAGNIDYGGASVEIDVRKSDGETCTSLTITYFGVGVSYQRCKKDDEDDEKEPPKEPPNDDDFPIPPLPPPPQIPGDPEGTAEAITSMSQFFLEKISYSYTDQTGEQVSYLSTYYSQGTQTGSLAGDVTMATAIGKTISISKNSGEEPIKIETNEERIWLLPWTTKPIPEYIKNDRGFKDYGHYQIKGVGGGQVVNHTGKVKDINSYLAEPRTNYTEIIENYRTTIVREFRTLDYYRILETGETGPPKKTPKEPEPPIPPEDDMTNCCDLEPVMSLLRKVSTAIGTDQLPAMMPKSFLKNEGFRKIPSLAELAVYHVEIMDQLIGKFPIELEIVDTDPLSPGDQTKKVVLNNIAETLAELFGLSVNSASDSAIQTTGTIKNLLEITLVRQAVLQNYYRLDAILDYLGAGLEEDTATFNSTISMPKDANNISEDPAEFLQQSEIKFAYDKLANPKDTLTAKLLPIQKAADIIKAKYWKGFGKAGGDYLGAIKSWLATYDPKNELNDTEWKDKIDKILQEYAKDATGNIDKDRMPVIQNVTQIGSEPTAPPPGA